MTAGSLWECCSLKNVASQTADLVPPWSLLSKLPLRAEEHLSMARSVLRKKRQNFGIWNVTKFSQLKSFLGITIATSSVMNFTYLCGCLIHPLLTQTWTLPCYSFAAQLLLSEISFWLVPKWVEGLLWSGKKSGCVFHSLVNVCVRTLAGMLLAVNWVLNTGLEEKTNTGGKLHYWRL